MRFVAAFLLACAAAAANAERILLIPLDSRPAAGQFAQMIAKTAGIDVQMPSYDDLGRFTKPGNPDAILNWLEDQDLSDVSAVIASADMVEYGGLIESRLNTVSVDKALNRVRRMVNIVRNSPRVKLYVFSATMRLLPTATRNSSKNRLTLGKYEEAKAKWDLTRNPESGRAMNHLRPLIPTKEVKGYEATRVRNSMVQHQLIHMEANHMFDYLIIGQDDARPFGPHVYETIKMKRLVQSLHTSDSVFFCEGVDQHASVLVSRAILTENGWNPKVRVVYSDEAGKEKYASYESKPIKESLSDQLLASGAIPAKPNEESDYTLYLNTPGRNEERFQEFVTALKSDIDMGFPTAVADIDLANDGAADPELFNSLWENQRMMKLLAYAGWNTAGNTMGTTIPAANVYLMSRRTKVDPLVREVAQREFLLHRFVNDFAYHKYTRPQAYKLLRSENNGVVDEVYGEPYAMANKFVQEDLGKHLDEVFRQQFLGRRFFAGTKQYAFSGISDVKIFLPWPRAYEVRLQFHLDAQPVELSVPTGPSSSSR